MSADLDTQTIHSGRWRVALGLVVAAGLVIGAAWLADRGDLAARQAGVAGRGAQVMPFSLDATTHVFDPTEEGGVQTVVADDPDDLEQVALIRRHLREEADRFARGDFDDPAAIHGQQMPGLQALRDGAGAIDIDYSDLPDGARIDYVTDDADLVDALHHWFDAQLRDHGHDAT